jgi:ribosomal protein S18 acetylase RimI-like enzyme
MNDVKIRPLRSSDSLTELTALLNRAYSRHAANGLNFLASHQDTRGTRQRIGNGMCLVAETGGAIVGTITYNYPCQINDCNRTDPFQVAGIAQLAVEPDYQGRGIGVRLMRCAEWCALSNGAKELVLDTAEAATSLIAWYRSLGYRIVSRFDSALTNYRSVIISKDLRKALGQ